MSKRYRLKNNIVDTDAGAIAEWDDDCKLYKMPKSSFISPHTHNFFTKGQVEEASDWFEKIIEPERIEVRLCLTLITKNKMEERDFPCVCVPFFGGEGDGPKKYRWEHASVVDSLVRGSADYFKLADCFKIEKMLPIVEMGHNANAREGILKIHPGTCYFIECIGKMHRETSMSGDVLLQRIFNNEGDRTFMNWLRRTGPIVGW